MNILSGNKLLFSKNNLIHCQTGPGRFTYLIKIDFRKNILISTILIEHFYNSKQHSSLHVKILPIMTIISIFHLFLLIVFNSYFINISITIEYIFTY
jgi:nitrogen fixation/metabolism regulation signal transduction histidine kinase